jgi:hypothetical protein
MKFSTTATLTSSSAFILAASVASIAHANGYVAAGMDTTENIVANANSDGGGSGGLFAVVVGSNYDYDGSPTNAQLSVGASSVSVDATLNVSGRTNTNGILDVNGGIVGENFSVANNTGNTSVGGTLEVTNATSLNSTLSISGTTSTNGILDVNGGIVGENFSVADDTGNTSVGGTLDVTNATSLNNTLVVSGATTVSNTFEVDTNGPAAGGTQISALSSSLTMSSDSVDIQADSSAGANAAITINGAVSANNTSNVGVLIKGSGQNGVSYDPTTAVGPATWADVSIQSANYGGADPTRGSAVIVTDFGVRLVSPDPAIGETVYNSQGGNNSAGTVNNSIGLNTGNGRIENAFGSASASSGAQSIITNTIGANNGSGAVSTLIGGGTSPTVNTVGNENAETRTTLQAGSSSLALEDSSADLRGGSAGNGLNINNTGVTFSNASGKPIRVTGVADGTSEFDAVNIGQFGSGMAALSAMNAVPDIREGDSISLGFGLGNYMGYNALAIAGKAYIDEKLTMNFAMATGNRSYEPVYSIGFGTSW